MTAAGESRGGEMARSAHERQLWKINQDVVHLCVSNISFRIRSQDQPPTQC